MDPMDIDNDWPSSSEDSDDNGSVNDIDRTMSDADGDVQLRSYSTLYPPALPSFADWSQHSWAFTARRDARNGFEVRQMNIDNIGETEVDALGQWPAKYMMRPPSVVPDWHPLIEKWGLQVLKEAGFINYVSKDPDDHAQPKGQAAEDRNPGDNKSLRIHPVFRKAMWKDLKDEDYKVIEPALLIASAYLDDEITLNYFHAVAAGPEEMGTFTDDILGVCKIATVPDKLPQEKQIEAYAKIRKMCDWTTWKFESVHRMVKFGCTGMTKPRFVKDKKGKGKVEKGNGKKGKAKKKPKRVVQAEREFTYQTDIIVSEAYLEILQQFDMDVSNGTDLHLKDLELPLRTGCVPNTHQIKIDISSAVERTHYLLATTLLHEFAHAFIKAWHQVRTDQEPAEPWITGNRGNEAGFAFTNFIMGGCPEGMSQYLPPMDEDEDHRQCICAPFGMYFPKKWDQWEVGFLPGGKGPDRVITADTQQAFDTPNTLYPVLQRFVHDLSTKETWEQQVPRYGLRTLQLPRFDDWAVHQLNGHRMKGIWFTGQNRWGDFDNGPQAPTWM
ncbi:hypothetical protein D6D01_10251 [Aureobasidium pullulans]|uniref:SprT-like domain-containing protein n=1 Tax=Aureobasidium pullulans TaxID=5580 RepID=A0A4S9JKX7_AURPU|nr:hypothetical protein D6D01_10251 [Aureobasidium pullulans]